MKVVILTDKVGSAIHEPELKKAKILSRHNIKVCDVHPKRPDEAQLRKFYDHAKDSDVIDYQYWKSAELVRGMYPELKKIKSLLTHHNPYDILNAPNEEYDMVFTTNRTMAKELKDEGVEAHCIPHGIDIDFFRYNAKYTEKKVVNMVVNRFESKKGVLPVAKACKELGYKFVAVGRISNPEYFEQCIKEGMEFHEGVSWEELRDIYYKSAIHICNSIDGFESGTLPMLEAMACGIPVITRNIGQVPDFDNGKNCVINTSDPENVLHLKGLIRDLMEDRDRRLSIISEGLRSVRQYSDRRKAFLYNRMYYYNDWYDYKHPFVSVIIPTYNDKESLIKLLVSIEKQDFPNIEIVVADDNSDPKLKIKEMIEDIRKVSRNSIAYVNTHRDGYNLAMARNLGAVNSFGDVLLFNDQRFEMKSETFITELVRKLEDKTFTYPAKECNGEMSNKTGFLEGICMVDRQDFFNAGMFNERISIYGGMSQEVRVRYERQGFKFIRVPSAVSVQSKKSGGREAKEAEIRIMKDQLIMMGFGR